MPITPAAAMAIQGQRRLTVEPTQSGWICRLPNGNRVRVDPQADQVAAIQAADAYLASREEATAKRDARSLIQEMQRGEYFHRPRTITEDDGSGEDREVVVFDILDAATGETTAIIGRRSVIEAWADLPTRVGGTP